MKMITVWLAKNLAGEFEHNHIEDGWSDSVVPTAVNDAQAKAWAGKEWQRLHRLLDEQNRIVTLVEPMRSAIDYFYDSKATSLPMRSTPFVSRFENGSKS